MSTYVALQIKSSSLKSPDFVDLVRMPVNGIWQRPEFIFTNFFCLTVTAHKTWLVSWHPKTEKLAIFRLVFSVTLQPTLRVFSTEITFF